MPSIFLSCTSFVFWLVFCCFYLVLIFPFSALFILFQPPSFTLFCSTSLHASSLPLLHALLCYSGEMQITSLYQRCQPSRKHCFHVMKLVYNPFKAVKPRLNINTPHYWPSPSTILLWQLHLLSRWTTTCWAESIQHVHIRWNSRIC